MVGEVRLQGDYERKKPRREKLERHPQDGSIPYRGRYRFTPGFSTVVYQGELILFPRSGNDPAHLLRPGSDTWEQFRFGGAVVPFGGHLVEFKGRLWAFGGYSKGARLWAWHP